MLVRKVLMVSLLAALVTAAGACSRGGTDTPGERFVGRPSRHVGGESINGSLVNFIKNSKLANYQATTIGDAIGAYPYLKKKEWKVEQQEGGYYTVDFLGRFDPARFNGKSGKALAARGIDITFIINPNGSFYVYMVSMTETGPDGKVHRHGASNEAVLSDIYASRKISF